MSGKINCLNFKRHRIIKRQLSKHKQSKLAFSLKITQIRIIYINFKANLYKPHAYLHAISLFFIDFAKTILIHNCNLYYFDKFRLKHKVTDKSVLIFFIPFCLLFISFLFGFYTDYVWWKYPFISIFNIQHFVEWFNTADCNKKE